MRNPPAGSSALRSGSRRPRLLTPNSTRYSGRRYTACAPGRLRQPSSGSCSRNSRLVSASGTRSPGRRASRAAASSTSSVASSEAAASRTLPSAPLPMRDLYHRARMARARFRRPIAGTGLVLAPATAATAGQWSLMAGTGAAWSLPTSLAIEQQGFPKLELTAHYDNRPFDSPIQWVARVSLGTAAGAWELQFLHHKLYLSNLPP